MSKYSYAALPSRLIEEEIDSSVQMIVCIPAYDEPNIGSTIQSLYKCLPPSSVVEIVILINQSEEVPETVAQMNDSCYETCVSWSKESPVHIRLYSIYIHDIPIKKSGVGMARKLAMDEAAFRLQDLTSKEGIIICLDADTVVQENYFMELENYFEQKEYDACSIHFEHKLENDDPSITVAILKYELHLRYFINMQRLIKLPYAFQTIGSAMAVRAGAYDKQGGMNTRKAGEDFYFLHKFIALDRCRELNSTTVYPSSRISSRVPFGTGKAVQDILSASLDYKTYHPQSFVLIADFLELVPDLYHRKIKIDEVYSRLDSNLSKYFLQEKLELKIEEIRNNTTSFETFMKRFFKWFNAFRLMKCLHYLRDHGLGNIAIEDAIAILFEQLELVGGKTLQEQLLVLREYDKTNSYYK